MTGESTFWMGLSVLLSLILVVAVTLNERLIKRLKGWVRIDEVTGLPDNRYVVEELTRLLAWAEAWGEDLAILFINEDHPTTISGTKLLVENLRRCDRVTTADFLGFWQMKKPSTNGAVLILLGRATGSAKQIAETIRWHLHQVTPQTISVGVVTLDAARREGKPLMPGALLGLAEAQMQKARVLGGDQVCAL